MKLFSRPKSRLSRAAQWFAQVRSGDMKVMQDNEWQHWMASDAENRDAYDQVQATWELAEELRDRPLLKQMLRDIERPRTSYVQRPMALGIAATLLLALIAGVFLKMRTTVADYATAVGEQRTLTLDDLSIVSLNTGTRIQVRYSRGLRRIDLLAGEAMFSVMHDSARPFEVHALAGTATAIGTEFDVQIAGTATTVSVLKGIVAVRPIRDLGDATQLSAGQAVDYSAGKLASPVRRADSDKVRGWLSQRIVLSNIPLAEALADYNRYIKTPIVLNDAELGTRHINGVFRMGDETAFLNALEQELHLKATVTPEAVHLDITH
jgi:transmembrane sensor